MNDTLPVLISEIVENLNIKSDIKSKIKKAGVKLVKSSLSGLPVALSLRLLKIFSIFCKSMLSSTGFTGASIFSLSCGISKWSPIHSLLRFHEPAAD